jgi:hypothetical protein
MTGIDQDQRIAEHLCQELTWDGRTFRKGEYVALLEGRIVAVSDSPLEAIRALRGIDPDPRHGMVVEVGQPEIDVIR